MKQLFSKIGANFKEEGSTAFLRQDSEWDLQQVSFETSLSKNDLHLKVNNGLWFIKEYIFAKLLAVDLEAVPDSKVLGQFPVSRKQKCSFWFWARVSFEHLNFNSWIIEPMFRHSSMDSSVLFILWSRVQIPSTQPLQYNEGETIKFIWSPATYYNIVSHH